MSHAGRGRRLRVSWKRALVFDFLHFARQVPSFPCDRLCDLSAVAAARAAAPVRISWPVLLMRAYALLAIDEPVLRRTWLRWPWPHLYEHAESVAMLTISRRWEEEDCLCLARFPAPERETLASLQQTLDRYRQAPVEQAFRKQWQLARLPGLLRRTIWGLNQHLLGHSKARRFGTFGMSILASQGAYNRAHPTVLTTCLTIGPLDERQRALLTLIYDHRLLDGSPAARCLVRLEEILNVQIVAELQALASTVGEAGASKSAAA